MEDIMRAVNLLQELCILLKGIDWILKQKNKKKQTNNRLISWFVVRHFRCYLLGNMLAGKGVSREAKGTVRAGEHFWFHLK